MNETVLSLVTFAIITTGTPGSATALATASGIRFGFRRSVPLIAGIALGIASLAAAAAVGLAGLLLTLPVLSFAMKLAGSAYLLWLAWKVGTAGSPKSVDGPGSPTGLLGGTFLLLLNPKGWATALAAAASFTAAAEGPAQLAALLAVTLGIASVISLSLWCVGGLLLSRVLKSERQWNIINAALGLLLAMSIIPIWRY